jgi:hypothetical protein
MPPIPPGGWTPESVREYWREGIAASPEGAPLSHAALADLLRTRDTFRNWFIVRKSTDWLSPVPLEETFIQRAYAFPLLCFFVVLGIAYALFTLFPWMRSLYPLIFLTEDTLCAAGRSVFTGPRYRCDNAVGALDFAFLSSIVCLAVIAFFFLRQGGGPVLRYSQKTKIVITNGGVFSALLLSLLVFITPAWILKFYAIDHELIPPILFITSPVLIPLAVMLLQAVWLTFRAAYAMIFFYMTSRFPSWLEDLSP